VKEFIYTITDPLGIHARPAGMIVKKAKEYQSLVTLTCGEKSAQATRLMSIMGMAIKTGNEVMVTVEGPDEEQAAADLEAFFKSTL